MLLRMVAIVLLALLVAGVPGVVGAQVPPVSPGGACPSGTLETGVSVSGPPVCTSVTSLLVSPQNMKGGATAQVINAAGYNPDWLSPDLFDPPQKYAGAGVQTFIAPQTQFILFPVSGTLPLPFESKLGFDIPYVNRNTDKEVQIPGQGTEERKGGLGDITLRYRFKYGKEEFAKGVTAIGVKLPTGDERQFEGGVEQLPSGTGSTDFILNQVVSLRRGPFRLVTSVGYRFNTMGAYSDTFLDGRPARFRQRQGDTFTGMGGIEYFTPVKGLSVYAKIAGMVTQRSKVSWGYEDDGSVILDQHRADSLKTIDVATGIVYLLPLKLRGRDFALGFHAGVLIPALTSFDKNVQNPTGRGVIFDTGFGGVF
jgi:hypothetical protein